MLCFVKTDDFVHVRCADQSSVQAIRPVMIRALDRLAEVAGLALAQARPAVPADIVESTHLSLLIAQDEDSHSSPAARNNPDLPGSDSDAPLTAIEWKNTLLFPCKNL